jgi:DNA-binding NtrC family response regulator
MTGSILIIDDDTSLLTFLSRYFQRQELEVLPAASAREGLELFERQRPDVVLLDLELPDRPGLTVLAELHAQGATVIMLTGHGDIPTAVQAMTIGAETFLTKPVDNEHLHAVVERALEKARLKRLQTYKDRVGPDGSLEGLGRSAKMRAIADEIERIAQAERATVLLLGESGTGKGWVAERIHKLSPRRSGPFVDINSATLTGTLLESELFGHEAGAFTDARSMKRGLFEVADGGTLLLDEIAEMDVGLQPKLLKALESQKFRRLGGTGEISVDVRLIAASNRDLQEAVEQKQFRDDLYYRLNVMPIELPPLRERGRDDLLALTFAIFKGLLREMPAGPQQISQDAVELLMAYAWPGNVRELRNVLERARIVGGTDEILEPSHLPTEFREISVCPRSDGPMATMREVEKAHIERVLAYCGGNRTRAAQTLGLSRATLHNKINKYGITDDG